MSNNEHQRPRQVIVAGIDISDWAPDLQIEAVRDPETAIRKEKAYHASLELGRVALREGNLTLPITWRTQGADV